MNWPAAILIHECEPFQVSAFSTLLIIPVSFSTMDYGTRLRAFGSP
jgi:hypothetical protein